MLCMVAIAASASKTVYLAPSDGWKADGARFALYHFTGDTAGPWADFTDTDGDGIFEATFDDTFESMIICRMNGGTTENNWVNKWNQTANLAAPGADGLLYTISGDTGSPTVTISIYGSTPATFTDGDKYIFKNVGSGRYLGPGNSWGTQASLLAQSHYNTIHAASGKYTIESQVSNGGTNYFFNGSFMDGGATNIDIVQLPNGNYVMTTTGTAFFGYDGTSTVLTTLADYSAANAQWQIINYNDALANASDTNPVDATFMILDQNFDRNNRNGGGDNNDLGNKWTMVAGNKNLCGGKNENKCAESWRSSFTLSQTITVPNGYYKIRAQAACWEYDVTGADYPVVYADEVSVPFNKMTDDSGGMEGFSTRFTNGEYFTAWSDMLTVTDNEIVVGVKGTRTNTWCIWDNIQLMYYGPIDLSGFATALADAVAAAQATNGTIPTACYNAIDAVVTENNKTYNNETDYLAAINAINTAISTYASADIVAAYARYNRIKTAVLAIKNDIDVSAADAQVEAATTNTEIDAVVPTLRNALTTYLAGITDQDIDVTDALIDNPSPGTKGNLEWWTTNQVTGYGNNLYEFYNKDDASSRQTIGATMPVGYYKLTVVGYTREGQTAKMFVDAGGNGNNVANQQLVGVASSTVNTLSQGNSWIAAGNGVNEMRFKLENTANDFTIGIWGGDQGDRWTAWRSFKLEFLGTAPLFIFQQELAAKVNEANDHATALGQTIPAGAMTAYNNAISEAAAKNTTIAECLQSIQDIENATAVADACVAPFAAYNALVTPVQALYDVADYEELTPGSHDDLGNALTVAAANVASAENAADIESVTDALKDASVTYVGAANPTGTAQFDLTYLLTNPNVDAFYTGNHGVKVNGWYTEQEGGNFQVVPGEGCANADGIHKHAYEYWSENPRANNKFLLYQQVQLPEGTYSIDCYAFADQPTGGDVHGVYFYANDTEGSCVTTNTLAEQGISFVNDALQDVKIGLKALTGNTYRWVGIGYMQLFKVAPKAYEVKESDAWDNAVSGAGDVQLTRTIKAGVNTLVLPFSMTQAEVESYFGAESKVYKAVLYDATTENISFSSREGISANEPCLLKATQAGTYYEIPDRTIIAGTPELSGTNVTMIGTYAASIEAPQGSYIINGGKIYKVDSNVTLKNTRAYVTVTGGSGARELNMSLDGEVVTGIATLENGELNVETGVIYDLSGRRVNSLSKGFYIINGKKVVK